MICLENFGGIVPRQDPEFLAASEALCAENVKLWHGRIDPWREPKLVADLGDENILAAHIRDCCWRGAYSFCTRFTDSMLDKRTFISDPCDCPQYVEDWCSGSLPCYIGYPCPDAPVTLTGDQGFDDDAFTEWRSYIITYGDDCHEGPPSKPSEPVKADKEDDVTIQLPEYDDKYKVTKIRIYRAMSTYDVTQGYQNPTDSRGFITSLESLVSGFLAPTNSDVKCFLVGCVDVGTGTFTDGGDFVAAGVGRSITSFGYFPPPDGLQIIGETDNGRLVGFVGNEVYFSEPNTWYGWSSKHRKTLDCCIKGGCVINNTILLVTESRPYLILDDAPCEANASGERTIRQLATPTPLCSVRSIVCTSSGMVYASDTGLWFIGLDGSMTNLSIAHFAEDDWADINPCTLRAEEYRGSYFFATDSFAGIYDLNLNGFSRARQNLTTICFHPTCWMKDKEGNLYFLDQGKVYQWEGGSEYMPYKYRSAGFRLAGVRSFSSASIEYSGLSKRDCTPCPSVITLYGDEEVKYQRPVNHRNPFRVCVNSVCRLDIGVTGEQSIRRICVGTGHTSLSQSIAA